MRQSFDLVPVPGGDVFGTESLTISVWSVNKFHIFFNLSFNVCFLERYTPRTLVRREAFCGIGLRSAKLAEEKGWKPHVKQEPPPNPEDDPTLRSKIT